MRVFVLTTGRTGSVSLFKACQKITNYSVAHESKSNLLGAERLDFPVGHIEVDNRLSWFIGQLHERYGDEAVYVHLKRDRVATAHSYAKRFNRHLSIVRNYCQGIKKTYYEKLTKEERLDMSLDLVDTINANIELFLSTKSKTVTIHLENFIPGFEELWDVIGAEGDIQEAIKAFEQRHNKHQQVASMSWSFWLKLKWQNYWNTRG